MLRSFCIHSSFKEHPLSKIGLVHPVATTLASPEDPAMRGFCKPLGMFKGAPKIEGPKAESGGEVLGEGQQPCPHRLGGL